MAGINMNSDDKLHLGESDDSDSYQVRKKKQKQNNQKNNNKNNNNNNVNVLLEGIEQPRVRGQQPRQQQQGLQQQQQQQGGGLGFGSLQQYDTSAIQGANGNGMIGINGMQTNANAYQQNQVQLARALSASLDLQRLQNSLRANTLTNQAIIPDSPRSGYGSGDEIFGNNNKKQSNVKVTNEEEIISAYRKKMFWISLFVVILLLYGIGILFLLFNVPTNCSCSDNSSTGAASTVVEDVPTSFPTLNPSNVPTRNPTDEPTLEPTEIPTEQPTDEPTTPSPVPPTLNPITEPTITPSLMPSNKPSTVPTRQPTIAPTVFDEFNIGDFKVSFLNASHNYWILCDGQFLDKRFYPLLFNVIGYSFGSSTLSTYLYGLPNTTDRIMAHAAGNGNVGQYQVGDYFGSYETTLTEENIPAHDHYMMVSGNCEYSYTDTTNWDHFAQYCTSATYVAGSNYYRYVTTGKSGTPDIGKTSTMGGNESFSLEQPAVVLGHVFIYAGEYSEE